jgi:hypothetical protein
MIILVVMHILVDLHHLHLFFPCTILLINTVDLLDMTIEIIGP